MAWTTSSCSLASVGALLLSVQTHSSAFQVSSQLSNHASAKECPSEPLFLAASDAKYETTRNNHFNDEGISDNSPTRRNFVTSLASTPLLATLLAPSSLFLPQSAYAAEPTRSTSEATITDKVFIEFKGIPSADGSSSSGDQRIVIGLFGNDAPQPVSILKQLVTKEGYKSKCKPLDNSRLLQKEQLEANKVYNACLENEVSYNLFSLYSPFVLV